MKLTHLVALLFSILSGGAPGQGAFPEPPNTPQYRAAMQPNLNLYGDRIFSSGTKPVLTIDAFNVDAVHLEIRRVLPQSPRERPLDIWVRASRDVGSLELQTLPRVKTLELTWPELKKSPNSWHEHQVQLQALPPGVYVARATGGGISRTRCLAATKIDIITTESRHRLVVFAAELKSGRPLPGMSMAYLGADGTTLRGRTNAQGVWESEVRALPNGDSSRGGSVYGFWGNSPAFALTLQPEGFRPYVVYLSTDRPAYRPGQTVFYHGVVRRRVEAEGPNGWRYEIPEGPVTVEIKDAQGVRVLQEQAKTDPLGGFSGSFPISPAPSLGEWSVSTALDADVSGGSFSVTEARQPELVVTATTGKARYLGGAVVPVVVQAKTFFGKPAVGAGVAYRVDFGQGEQGVEAAYAGQGLTDSNGRFLFSVPTRLRPLDRQLTVSATITDLNRRSQTATTSALITAGLFELDLLPDRREYLPNQPIRVRVRTRHYDGSPVSTPVQVALLEDRYDRLHRPYQQSTLRHILTNSTGEGTVTFTSPRSGSLTLQARAWDAQGNTIRTSYQLYVLERPGPAAGSRGLTLSPDKSEYAPGETAAITISAPPAEATESYSPPSNHRSDGWVFLTLEGEGLYQHQVVRIHGPRALVRERISLNYFPAVYVSASMVWNGKVANAGAWLGVKWEQPKLKVELSRDRSQYGPGDSVVYNVRTRDYLGRPVPAEVSLAAVNQAAFKPASETSGALTHQPGMYDAFYRTHRVRVLEETTFNPGQPGEQVFPGFADFPDSGLPTIGVSGVSAATSDSGQPGASGARRHFEDTAVWAPAILTNSDGEAKLTFHLPDNLTTWDVSARAFTQETAVGSAHDRFVVTKPLAARLELPEFFVEGDRGTASAVLHNNGDIPRTVSVSLDASGCELQGDRTRSIRLAPGDEQRLDWAVRVGPRVTQPDPWAPSPLRFRLSAKSDDGASDAVEYEIPARPDGLQQVDAKAQSLAEDGTLRQDLTTLPPGAALVLTLSPSIGASVVQAVDTLRLDNHSYCAAGIVADHLKSYAAAKTALHRLGLDQRLPPGLDDDMERGIQSLYRYQHQDGGWNLWEFDQSSPAMTAYVLGALLDAADAGFAPDRARLNRAVRYLADQYLADQVNKDFDSERAETLLSLSRVNTPMLEEATAQATGAALSAPLKQISAGASSLGTFVKASLALALHNQGAYGSGSTVRALPLTFAREIESSAVEAGTTVHWNADPNDGSTDQAQSDIATTAAAVQALEAIDPASKEIAPAVRWLMGNRAGSAWSSSMDTAAAEMAVAGYLLQTGELHPSFRARVLLDGREVGRLNAAPGSAFDTPLQIPLSSADLTGHRELAIDRVGQGVLYVTSEVHFLTPPGHAESQETGLSVSRSFTFQTEDPSRSDTIPSGMRVVVHLDVKADFDCRYVRVEDSFPAGWEISPESSFFQGGDASASRPADADAWHDRVVFYLPEIERGHTRLSYTLIAVTPGTYAILPDIVSLIHFPEVRGSSKFATTKIGERP